MEELVTPKELCKVLKVSKLWPYRAARTGLIPHHKIGQLVRFKKADIEAYIQKTRKGGDKGG